MEIIEKKPIIFVLAGPARSGKDTVASYIKEYYEKDGKKVINLQFSYYIKMYAKMVSNWDGSDENKPRELLQQLGTDIIRKKIDERFFVNRIIDDIKVCKYFADIITISDSRIPIELDTVYNTYENVHRIKLERPDFENELTGKEKKHITETALENYNDYEHIIINDGTLDDLQNKVYKLLDSII